MADTTSTGYLSIGEVLGLLLEEFPDVTISKIRFLESQGLISPERTASGYRKFYDEDVQLLRVILAEQRQNYLPLRVIKDRLETGEIDPTGEHLRPNGVDPDDDATATDGQQTAAGHPGEHDEVAETIPVPSTSIASHPAARNSAPSASGDPVEQNGSGPTDAPADEVAASSAQLLPGVLLDRAELCAMVGMTDTELGQLESFGLVGPRDAVGPPIYGEEAVEVAAPACAFLRAGVDARHLRNWRTSAEREASLYEQLVTPRFRQRNPEARAEALVQLRELEALGGQLREVLMRQMLRHHFEA